MNCAHRDCGCRYGAPCCLNCPLPECVFALDPYRHQRARARAIATYNQSITSTAARFRVSARTVYRIRRQHKLAYNRHAVRSWNLTPEAAKPATPGAAPTAPISAPTHAPTCAPTAPAALS